MILQIKTLSPLHIGNGEKYNGMSYFQDKRSSPVKLYYLEFDAIKSVLSVPQLQNFVDWITTERFPSLFKFLRKINDRNNAIANNLISRALYKIDLLFKEDPQQRIFLGDIEAFLKQNNKPYIPGTEIKGAIRTATAYCLLQKNIYWERLNSELRNFTNRYNNELAQVSGQKGRRVNEIKKELVNKMGGLEDKLQGMLFRVKNNNDAKYDFLKLLHIGDTELKNPNACLFVSNLKVEGINKGFPLFQELCKKDQIFNCQGFKLDSNKTFLNNLGFSDEQKWVISDTKNLFQCCHEFSNRLLKEEIDYFAKLNINKIVTKLKNIEQQNKPDSPVIRIGKNEGYLSLTMGLLVKDKDKNLYDKVLCHATKNTSYTGNFPKTRKVVNLENGDVDTCGWVKLTLLPQ